MKTLDPDLLRTLVTFVDAGSLARAATIVGRTPSAVTAQMQRLEDMVGERLLLPSGRGRVLTPAGEELVIHARRILDAHRDAWLSLAGARADGRLAIAATQDFADTTLPPLLRLFARSHTRVRIELRIGRTGELTRAFAEGGIDILLAMRTAPIGVEIGVLRERMIWVGARDLALAREHELPLAVLDQPCTFRTTALEALESAARPYRIAATSGSLSGLRAAVAAGLAVTARTVRWLRDDLEDVSRKLDLPPLPDAHFTLALRERAGAAARDFADLLGNELGIEHPS